MRHSQFRAIFCIIYTFLTGFLLTLYYDLHVTIIIYLFIVSLAFFIPNRYKKSCLFVHFFLIFFAIGITGYQAYFKIPFEFTTFQYMLDSQGYFVVALKITLTQLFSFKTYLIIIMLFGVIIYSLFLFPLNKKQLLVNVSITVLIFFLCLFYFHKFQDSTPENRMISNSAQSKNQSNILIIMIESLWAPITKLKIDDKFVMPYYNSLRSDAVYFPYISSVGGPTLEKEIAFFSLNTLNLSIPKIYKDNNFYTYYIHNGKDNFFNRRIDFASKYQFSKMIFENDIPQLQKDSYFTTGVTRDRIDRSKYAMAKESDMFSHIKKALPFKEPFYMHILTITGHYPYVSNPDIYNYYPQFVLNEIDDRETYKYSIKSMAYIDDLLFQFIPKMLKKHPNTHILIVGDTSFTHPVVRAPYLVTESILIPSKTSSIKSQNNIYYC